MLILVGLCCHRKDESAVLSEEKNEGGSVTGTACMMYRSLGKIDILIMAALPNQEKHDLFQEVSRDCTDLLRVNSFWSIHWSSVSGFVPKVCQYVSAL